MGVRDADAASQLSAADRVTVKLLQTNTDDITRVIHWACEAVNASEEQVRPEILEYQFGGDNMRDCLVVVSKVFAEVLIQGWNYKFSSTFESLAEYAHAPLVKRGGVKRVIEAEPSETLFVGQLKASDTEELLKSTFGECTIQLKPAVCGKAPFAFLHFSTVGEAQAIP